MIKQLNYLVGDRQARPLASTVCARIGGIEHLNVEGAIGGADRGQRANTLVCR